MKKKGIDYCEIIEVNWSSKYKKKEKIKTKYVDQKLSSKTKEISIWFQCNVILIQKLLKENHKRETYQNYSFK